MFLRYLGFDPETIELVSPRSVVEKESIRFPFLFTDDFETIFIDKSIKRSKSGIFLVSPDRSMIKSVAYYFASVYEMMCFYQRSNRRSFKNTLFVVTPMVIEKKDLDYVISQYPTIVKHYLALTDNIRLIKISSFLSELNIKVSIVDEKLFVTNDRKGKHYLRFSFSKYAKDFRIRSNIKSLNIKKFLL